MKYLLEAHPGFCGTDIHLHSGIGRPAVGKWLYSRDLQMSFEDA